MIQMKWKMIAAALAISLLLSACGADGAQDPKESAGPGSTPPSGEISSETTPVETKNTESEALPTESAAPEETSELSETPEIPEHPSGKIEEGEAVDAEWFADAVFLGDSRTDGLQLYSGIEGATFFSYKGLSVFTIDEKECIELDGQSVTVLDALSRGEYAKVYVMLGINELGYQSTEAFKDAYSELVTSIREIQPDADIYLQTQPPVNETVAAEKGMADYINNERICLFNDLIAEVAEEQGTALVDVWEAYEKEDGGMPTELTSDGVHMKRAGYEIWYEYLRTHTGTTQPAAAPAQSQAPTASAGV